MSAFANKIKDLSAVVRGNTNYLYEKYVAYI